MASATRAHNGADKTRRQSAVTMSTTRLQARAPYRPAPSFGTGEASHVRSAAEIRASTRPFTGVQSPRVVPRAYTVGRRPRATRTGTIAGSLTHTDRRSHRRGAKAPRSPASGAEKAGHPLRPDSRFP